MIDKFCDYCIEINVESSHGLIKMEVGNKNVGKVNIFLCLKSFFNYYDHHLHSTFNRF
jgi:hypothetical protein